MDGLRLLINSPYCAWLGGNRQAKDSYVSQSKESPKEVKKNCCTFFLKEVAFFFSYLSIVKVVT